MNSLVILIVTLALILAPWVWTFFVDGKVSARDYRASPSAFSSAMVSISTIGTIVGGAMFLAVGQIGFEAGVAGFILGLVYLVAFSLFGIFSSRVAVVMEQEGVDTVYGLIEKKGTLRMSRLYTISNCMLYTALVGSQVVVAKTFYTFLISKGVHELIVGGILLVAFLVVLSYSWVGGLKKDIRTDAIQMIVVTTATGIIVWLMIARMPVSVALTSLPSDHFSGVGYGVVYTIALVVFIGPMVFVRPDIWQRAVALKNKRRIFPAFFATGVVAMFAFGVFTFLGMWARANFPTSVPASATLEAIWAVTSGGTGLIAAIIIGGLFAAILSTADTLINNAAVHFEGAMRAHRALEVTGEGDDIGILRIGSLGAIFFGISLSFLVTDVVDLISASFSLLLVFLPVFIALFRKSTFFEPPAFYSAVFGIVSWIFALFVSNEPKEAFAYAVIASWLVYGLLFFLMHRAKDIKGVDLNK
jgi:Na+/proline symporter